MNIYRNVISNILKKLVVDPTGVDGRSLRKRRNTVLTPEFEAFLVKAETLEKMKNLSLRERSHMIKAEHRKDILPGMLRTVYLRNKVSYRLPYVNPYARAYEKENEIKQ